MLTKTEQALNGANIATCFATVATATDLTLTGGAGAAIGAALSGLSVFKGLSAPDRNRTETIAKTLDAQLAAQPGDTAKLVRQLISRFPVT